MSDVTAEKTLTKQPAESLVFTFDFTPILERTETITSVTSVAATVAGLTISGAAANTTKLTVDGNRIAIGKAVQARISSGASGTTYRIECIVVTGLGNTRELDGLLEVTDT